MNQIDTNQRVPNKDRRFGAAPEYYPAYILVGDKYHPALFTWNQIEDAIRRAEANPEDMPKPTFWQRIKAWFWA